jgi:two-component system OmpR family sensor kinase
VSIRLRLTLTYTIILGLTLALFSLLVYFSQSQFFLVSSQDKLINQAALIAEAVQSRPQVGEVSTPDQPPIANVPEKPASRFETYYIQIRDQQGKIIERSANLAQVTLPLSAAGLNAVQHGEGWLEAIVLDNERLLIYSRPVSDTQEAQKIVQVALSLAPIDDGQGVMRNVLIVINSVLIVAAFGIGWILAGITLRPIHRLTQTAQAIGAKRDFARRVEHIGPNDEIGQLASTFNMMLSELQAAYMQVEQTLEIQRRFVADASHELRTPLTTLRGNIGLLRRKPPIGTADQADVSQDMVDEIERLMRLVNNLLVLARADAKKPLRSEPVAVQPLLEDVCRQTQLLDLQRTIVCQSNAASAIKGDADALKQVLLALLDNALKHTPINTTITITTTDTTDHVIIRLADDGPGIEPTLLPHIFDRFYRGNVARVGDGAGLGLAIAKELTEAQQGTITVQSQAGQGSVFTLTFPKESLPPDQVAYPPVR